MGYRIDRTAEDIKRELCDIMRGLKDPRLSSFLTVIRVDLTNDLSVAKCYISSLQNFDKAKEAVKGLAAAEGYIKHELNVRLKLRKIPRLVFVPDNSTEHGAHINQILESFSKGDKNHDDD